MAFAEVEDRFGACEVIVFPNVLEDSREALYIGSVVFIEGTLSCKEDEEPRVLADKITAMPPASQLKTPAGRDARHSKDNERHTAKARRLYLRVPSLDSEEFRKAENILSIFPGDTAVVFYLSDSGSQVMAPGSLWTAPNPTMLSELEYQLGDGNAVLR